MKIRNYWLCLAAILVLGSCTKQTLETPVDVNDESLEFRSEFVKFRINDATTEPGDEVCLDVSVRKFQDILSAQYSIGWRKRVLQFKEVRNFNLPGLSAANFGNPADNRLTFAWFDENLLGVSLPNNTVIYQVCFDVIGEPGDFSKVKLREDPTPIEVTDADFSVVEVKKKKGVVTVE